MPWNQDLGRGPGQQATHPAEKIGRSPCPFRSFGKTSRVSSVPSEKKSRGEPKPRPRRELTDPKSASQRAKVHGQNKHIAGSSIAIAGAAFANRRELTMRSAHKQHLGHPSEEFSSCAWCCYCCWCYCHVSVCYVSWITSKYVRPSCSAPSRRI